MAKDSLGLPHDLLLEVLRDHYQRELTRGVSTGITRYLAIVPPDQRENFFRELLVVEQHWREQAGEPHSVSRYEEDYPSYTEAIRELHRDPSSQETVGAPSDAPPDAPHRSCHQIAVNESSRDGANTTVQFDNGDTSQYQAESTVDGAKTKPQLAFAGSSQTFAGYEIISEIARGGMGVVFKARQTKLNRIVALKMILSGELAGSDGVQRFRAEAQAAAHLDHSGIVPIFDIGEHRGQHYFSMAYIDGTSLADRLGAGPLPAAEAAELVHKIANAIAYAHDKGVIHRDLKPANVLLDQSGEPKITDFGLAKQLDSDHGLTQTGAVMGTPRYMSPEQASGRTESIGPVSDVYAMGAILYEAVTGRPPFQAANLSDLLGQVINNEAVGVRQLNPAIERDLETIVHKCLRKDPSRRYSSSSMLAQDLEAYLDGRPIRARRVSRGERLVRWCRRHPARAIAISLAMLALTLLGGLAVGYGYQRQLVDSLDREQELNANLNTSVEEAKAQRQRAEEQEAIAKQLSYAADINLAQRLWENNEVPRALDLLNHKCRIESASWWV